MPLALNSGAVVADVWYEDAGGTKRRLKEVWVMDAGGTMRQVFAAPTAMTLAVVVSPPSYSIARNSATTGGDFSQTFTATPSGGTGPYGGSWLRTAAGPNMTTVAGDSTPALTLSGSWPQHAGREYSETWRYTATDSLGATAFFDITLYVYVTDNA